MLLSGSADQIPLLDLLDGLQAHGQVVVLVIDDLQWADRPSSRAVLFALRRLRADKMLAVVSVAGMPDARCEVDAAVAAGLLTEGAPVPELAFALEQRLAAADLNPPREGPN